MVSNKINNINTKNSEFSKTIILENDGHFFVTKANNTGAITNIEELNKSINKYGYDMSSVNYSHVIFKDINFTNVDFSDSIFKNTIFSNCVMDDTNFSDSNLSGSQFYNSQVENIIYNQNTNTSGIIIK